MLGRVTFTKGEGMLALLTALVIFSGLTYVYVIEPVAFEWSEVRGRSRKAVEKLAKLQALVERREEIERGYRQLEGAVSVRQNEHGAKVTLLKEVEKLARESGLQVTAVKPTSTRKEGVFDRYGVQLNARSENHNFVTFLQAIQRPEHLLNAERITLVAGRSRPTLSLTVVVTKLVRLEGN